MATTLAAFDPTTMTFGAAKFKEGDPHGYAPLKMPMLQVGTKDAPVCSTYGVNPAFAKDGRAPLELLVDPVQQDAVRDFEAHVKKVFADNARAWFKKDKPFQQKSVLRETDFGTVLKTKFVLEGSSKATVVKLLTNGKLQREPGTLTSVNYGCEVVAYVQSSQLWFNTLDCTYGVAFTAKALFVKPGTDGPPPIDADALALDAGFEYE